jgi:hypothetical protein
MIKIKPKHKINNANGKNVKIASQIFVDDFINL